MATSRKTSPRSPSRPSAPRARRVDKEPTPTVHRPLSRKSLAIAVAQLSDADPLLGSWIERSGPCILLPETEGTHFDALARSIIHQQLAGKAARAIHDRFNERIGRKGILPDVHDILSTRDEELRSCGLSGAKAAALRDLAERISDGTLPVETLDSLPDDKIIDLLTQVRGIGPWTAQMFLMFRLGRPDVLPVLDLGVRKGAQKIYRMRNLPDAKRLEKTARAWQPWRSVASWYCWRVLEL